MASNRWPELGGDGWQATVETVHLWSQIVGKVRMALEPPVNHWWHVALYVSARGLTTSLMPAGDQSIEIEFDFREHELAIRSTTGDRRAVALEPRTVADFHTAVMAALAELGVHVSILARPVEVPVAIPFADDTVHASYEPEAMTRFWLALVQIDRVFRQFRGGFVGKASPIHFFWGGFDLATTRFSGRPAPRHRGGIPNCADWVMEEAYSHELSSAGFWPGGSDEGCFYAYAYPEPEGFREWPVRPGTFYDATLGEFLLPYREVRTADDPDTTLLEFLQATYEAGAVAGGWDRESLERAG